MFENLRLIEKKLLKSLDFKYKRYFFKRVDFSSRLIGIVGSRGVGKTTFLLQHLKDLKESSISYKSLYFSFDHPANVDIKLFELADEFEKRGGVYLLVDECHRYKNFALDLKAIYDFLPKLKVIFTGSSAIQLYNSQADLSRRALFYHMNGLSYREFLELKLNISLPNFKIKEILENHIEIADKVTLDLKPLEYFEEYLKYGYYPFYFSDPKNYLKLLLAVINQTIDIDLVMLGFIKPQFANKLKKLLKVICYSKPFELNITKVASQIEINRNTLYSYLEKLTKSDLILSVSNNKKGLTSLSKPEKLYLNNTNLFYSLCENSSTGTIREAFFANQLQESHSITTANKGDFIIDDKYIIEIGGKGKGFSQIKDIKNSYLAIDTDFTENPHKIPLWLFGFLY